MRCIVKFLTKILPTPQQSLLRTGQYDITLPMTITDISMAFNPTIHYSQSLLSQKLPLLERVVDFFLIMFIICCCCCYCYCFFFLRPHLLCGSLFRHAFRALFTSRNTCRTCRLWCGHHSRCMLSASWRDGGIGG